MFHTKNLVHDIKDVPSPWIFEHFCKLPYKLTGNDVKIKSMFNSKDSNPSMAIYFDGKKNAYKFKDFSTGRNGDAVQLVKDLFGLSYSKSANLIIEHYNDYVLHNNGGYDMKDFKEHSRYKVTSVVYRSWSSQDQYFWTQFNIGSKLLDEHNVRPLASYTMAKMEDDNPKELTITGNYLYGYFKEDGTLYKIYQPKTLDKKFIKVTDYVQGFDQLKGYDHLLITSSLKDIMAIKSLKLKIDIIAPDSENTIIKADLMNKLKKQYANIIVMFDNDEPGIAAMKIYKEKYPFVEITILAMSKDPSDSIKDFGAKTVRTKIIPTLDKKLVNDKEKANSETASSKNQECRNNDRVLILEFH